MGATTPCVHAARTEFSNFARYGLPMRSAMRRYAGWRWKKAASARWASAMGTRSLMSFWLRFTTPTNPLASCVVHQRHGLDQHSDTNGVKLQRRNLTGMTRFCSTSTASVPASIRSSFVSTPIVRTPCMESMRRNATSATCVCARVCRGTSSGSHLFVHLSGQLQRLADAQPCQWNNGACTT